MAMPPGPVRGSRNYRSRSGQEYVKDGGVYYKNSAHVGPKRRGALSTSGGVADPILLKGRSKVERLAKKYGVPSHLRPAIFRQAEVVPAAVRRDASGETFASLVGTYTAICEMGGKPKTREGQMKLLRESRDAIAAEYESSGESPPIHPVGAAKAPVRVVDWRRRSDFYTIGSDGEPILASIRDRGGQLMIAAHRPYLEDKSIPLASLGVEPVLHHSQYPIDPNDDSVLAALNLLRPNYVAAECALTEHSINVFIAGAEFMQAHGDQFSLEMGMSAADRKAMGKNAKRLRRELQNDPEGLFKRVTEGARGERFRRLLDSLEERDFQDWPAHQEAREMLLSLDGPPETLLARATALDFSPRLWLELQRESKAGAPTVGFASRRDTVPVMEDSFSSDHWPSWSSPVVHDHTMRAHYAAQVGERTSARARARAMFGKYPEQPYPRTAPEQPQKNPSRLRRLFDRHVRR